MGLGHSEKGSKINAQITLKSDVFWTKIRSGADLGRLILSFWPFWSDVKKSSFFDAFPVAPKIKKISPRAILESLGREIPSTFCGMGSPMRGLPARKGTWIHGARERFG